MNKTIDYYMGLPYSITLHPSPEGGYAVANSGTAWLHYSS